MILKAGTYTMHCAFCGEPSPAPVCAKCQQKIDELTTREVARNQRGRLVQRKLTAYRNFPKGPEVTA
jgi:hypothetical protein